ncbi:hypothetical protein GCM10011571_33570 [Marinithermofilum abyssi]|uniref:Uncharacterized protein n=1 Tax=Marinithermofilum abyssi TaxID=1571185 RepID=A0A8J2VEG7_9BACL|nr:hypothetical protein [Marinithermofilum abyssi]GGE28731.1 hypothetical protein GCM10011571_33570 [Marinithermofilum abyssi]
MAKMDYGPKRGRSLIFHTQAEKPEIKYKESPPINIDDLTKDFANKRILAKRNKQKKKRQKRK